MIEIFCFFVKNQNIFFLITVKVGLVVPTTTVLFIFLPDLLAFPSVMSFFKQNFSYFGGIAFWMRMGS
jgi:hypothetical protein